MRFVYKTIATAFGSGYSPLAPGTAGAIVACGLLWFFNQYHIISTDSNPFIFIVLIVLTTLIGFFTINQLSEEWGEDPSKVVIDEVVGMWITMIFIPFTWINVLLGFILFRFFDIAKPLGVRKMENLKGGLGVMMDDVLAGVYSNIILYLINYIISVVWV